MALRSSCQTEDNQSPNELLAQRPHEPDNASVVSELRRSVKSYEDRYNMPSDRLEAALAAGEITETLDVCDWLIQYSMLLRAEAR
jgi:hypothetical protein